MKQKKVMKKLKLPIIKDERFSEPPVLSMDEYYEFVMFNWKYCCDREAIREWKKLTAVDVPFVLKD